MTEIIPAIMPETLDDVAAHASQLRGAAQTLQLDIMDGTFVPERTWPYTGGKEVFERITSESEGLPFWEEFDFEVDLMVERPEESLWQWITAGAKRLIVHIESTERFGEIVEQVREGDADGESLFAVELGIALNIETPNEAIEQHLSDVDAVQFMGIERIGFQGEPFDERVLDKVQWLRNLRPDVTISVDGGVSEETAPALVAAGANRLAVGSAIFRSDDPKRVIRSLRALGA